MKRLGYIAMLLVLLCCSACKLSTPIMKMLIKANYKNMPQSTVTEDYANRIGVPYVEDAAPEQVVDIFYAGPLFLSTCTNDFIRGESLKLKADCDALGRDIVFIDIQSNDRQVGHVHNVASPALPESQEVNAAMIDFMNHCL